MQIKLWQRMRVGLMAVLAAAAVSSLRATFTDVTLASGLNYVQSARVGNELAVFAGAIAAVDVDGDGWVDVVAARSDGSCLLFRNKGDGTFSEEGAARGLAGITEAGGIAAGDFSNNGRQDLFITPLTGKRCYFLVNDGMGHFTEQAVERGCDLPTSLVLHQGFSVSVVDYDRDGYLDIYFTEWGTLSSSEDAVHSALLHNRGSAAPGHFENRTAAAGLTQPKIGSTHRGYSAAWADFDEDGWPDLMLVSDFGTSQFFWNNGDGSFTERTKSSGLGQDENGMGVTVGDYDGDGKLDVLVTSIYDRVSFAAQGLITGNKLYRNTGNRTFVEAATTAGVNQTGWSWGAAFFDYDNRGAVDLIVTNGITNGLVPDPQVASSNDAENDPTTLFLNNGLGGFSDRTIGSGITDNGQGRAVLVFDYDKDGDQDILISQAYGSPILYRNNAAGNGNHWLGLHLQGVASNRNAVGAVVRVTSGGRMRTQVYGPTNGFLAQSGPVMHFGLGNEVSSVEKVEITWPNGAVQLLTNLAPDQTHTILEQSQVVQSPPRFTQQPVGGDQIFDESLTLTVAAEGSPAPVFVWERDGVTIPGATGATYTIRHLHPLDAGTYTAKAVNPAGTATSSPAVIRVVTDLNLHSVAGWWNRVLLDAIRADLPFPTVHSRNLYHVSAAMWDAYWSYDPTGWQRAKPVFHQENIDVSALGSQREAAQLEAISYAAYRVLIERYRNSVGHTRSEAAFRWLMSQLGYNPDFTGTSGESPATVGNRIGFAVLAANRDDGANEAGNYADTSGYTPRNAPLDFKLTGTVMQEPNYWQPLLFDRAFTQNGIELGATVQSFVGSNWRMVRGFALDKPTPSTVAIDPGPPPRLNSETAAEYRQQALEVIRYSSQLDPSDGVLIDISPGAMLNNDLGTNNGHGHVINPITNQAYAANMVRRGDYGRVMAEFWADGPDSETPPGHWNVIFNDVAADARTTRRFGGAGSPLTPLEWDVCGYLALNGAMHDAAIAAWTLKRQYDSVRPISMIRYLAGLGQSSDPAQPSYNAEGLPLESGLVEVVTTASSAPGQRHANLASSVGKIAIKAWQGEPANFLTETGGVGWILAERWMPYQLNVFVTPSFAGYVSGHSAFSRAGAEAMTYLTGTAFFPGGLGEYHFPAGRFLLFEYGPQEDLTLQWATYYDASDNAGSSRLWGGIHILADDFEGRKIGSTVGKDAFFKTQLLRGGSAAPPPAMPSASPSSSTSTSTTITPSTSTGGAIATGGGGGGGGAPSWYFFAALGLLPLLRILRGS